MNKRMETLKALYQKVEVELTQALLAKETAEARVTELNDQLGETRDRLEDLRYSIPLETQMRTLEMGVENMAAAVTVPRIKELEAENAQLQTRLDQMADTPRFIPPPPERKPVTERCTCMDELAEGEWPGPMAAKCPIHGPAIPQPCTCLTIPQPDWCPLHGRSIKQGPPECPPNRHDTPFRGPR